MALECNLSADKMIKKIFIFIYTGDPFLGCWKTDSEPIRKKFEMNGYVMPNIVCWDLKFRLIPIVISTGDMKTCLASTTGHGWCECIFIFQYCSRLVPPLSLEHCYPRDNNTTALEFEGSNFKFQMKVTDIWARVSYRWGGGFLFCFSIGRGTTSFPLLLFIYLFL